MTPAKREELLEKAVPIRARLESIPSETELEKAYLAGMLRKEQLERGKYYLGICRNANVAKWNPTLGVFTYMRTKFGDRFHEHILHPADDTDGYDVFVPVAEIEPDDDERVPG